MIQAFCDRVFWLRKKKVQMGKSMKWNVIVQGAFTVDFFKFFNFSKCNILQTPFRSQNLLHYTVFNYEYAHVDATYRNASKPNAEAFTPIPSTTKPIHKGHNDFSYDYEVIK